jgi:hypothetical protein
MQLQIGADAINGLLRMPSTDCCGCHQRIVADAINGLLRMQQDVPPTHPDVLSL